jgi:rhomboid family GlyGly-CTERM serine protease
LAFAVDRFQWDFAMRRDAVVDGELVRLVTGHFAHFNRAHLLGDALAFAFWAACLEQLGRVRFASTLLVTTMGSSLVFIAFCPDVAEYRGLSAVDCALAAQLIVLGMVNRRRAGDTAGTLLFAVAGLAFLGKTAFEFRAGYALLAPDLGDSVSLLPVAHVAGIVLGLACLVSNGPDSTVTPPRNARQPRLRPSRSDLRDRTVEEVLHERRHRHASALRRVEARAEDMLM